MIIKAIKLYENGFMTQPFAFGGEDGMQAFNNAVRYRSSLQNYLIDTGKEVILIDTGMPSEVPDAIPDEKTMIYMGTKIKDYVSALKDAGYTPEQVDKILITHKHADHTGELRAFPNAKIYVNEDETNAAEFNGVGNIIPVKFTGGAYHNFPESQPVADGVYYIKAKGHTNGNSIVIAEDGGLFYMFHGDITYTDEALYNNKLSVVFEDIAAARETLDRVREFIKNNPTVYLSTHTPLGFENLEKKRVMDLDNPVPTVFPEIDFSEKQASGKYVCAICGYVYDPAENGGVAFGDLPEDWKCPRCKQPKDKFNPA
ncbi:MAG: MBL fold metallo-hydrolase [Clostridia bacterium]|nr:MBL fold metallo-hydrolase [Clostridia bacterium]